MHKKFSTQSRTLRRRELWSPIRKFISWAASKIFRYDSTVDLLFIYQNQVARRTICALILGSPPAKVYGNMRNAAARMGERF